MGLVESAVDASLPGDDEFDGFSDEEDGPDGSGSVPVSDSAPFPMKGLRVLSVEQGSPAACSKLLAWVQAPLGGGASTKGPHDGLTSFSDVILSVNGIECGGSTNAFLELVRSTTEERSPEEAESATAVSGAAKDASAASHVASGPAEATTSEKGDNHLSADRPAGAMDLEVLDSFTESTRFVRVIPSKWSGHGVLGMSVSPVWIDDEAEETAAAAEAEDLAAESAGYALPFAMRARQDVLKVTEVLPGGPASLARLSADGDVILGADGAVFSTVEGFGQHISERQESVITLHVFNSGRRTVRDVPIFVTTRQWGPATDRRSGIGLAVSGGLLAQIPMLRHPPRNEWAVAPHRRQLVAESPALQAPRSAAAVRKTAPRTAGLSAPSTAPSGATTRSRVRESGSAEETSAGTPSETHKAGESVAAAARTLFESEKHALRRPPSHHRDASDASQTLTPIVGPHSWAEGAAAAPTAEDSGAKPAVASPVMEPEI